MVPVSQEALVRIIELAGAMTQEAKHPSPAVTDAGRVLDYRLELFAKAARGLYNAVAEADEAIKGD